MASFKELFERYDELSKLTEQELVDKIGSWWAYMFINSKDDIAEMLGKTGKDERKDGQ